MLAQHMLAYLSMSGVATRVCGDVAQAATVKVGGERANTIRAGLQLTRGVLAYIGCTVDNHVYTGYSFACKSLNGRHYLFLDGYRWATAVAGES